MDELADSENQFLKKLLTNVCKIKIKNNRLFKKGFQGVRSDDRIPFHERVWEDLTANELMEPFH